MRIGFFTDTYLPVVHGVEVSIETSRRALEAMGHQVFIYAPKSPGYKDKNPNVFRFRSVRVIKKPEMRYAFNFLPVGRSFRKISHFKLDVAHAHTPFGLGLLAKYISERQLIPLIYTHHTHYPEYAKFYLKEEVLLPYLAKVYSTWFSNISDVAIAPSLKIKKLLLSYGAKKKTPIYVLPTGIDLKIFKKFLKSGRALRKKLKIPLEAKVLISVGRIGKEKNVEFLIKGFAEVLKKRKDILLLMVGDGPFLKKLKKTAQNLKIAQSIIFTGKVPRLKIPAFYQSADVFLFASLTDTQGIVILEALACGLPVIALKDDAFINIIANNKNGFLINPARDSENREKLKKESISNGTKQYSPKLFAQKIITLLDNSSLYEKFSARAIKTAQNFSEKNMAKELIEIYRTQIEKRYQIKK